jgi:hypothetical protein
MATHRFDSRQASRSQERMGARSPSTFSHQTVRLGRGKHRSPEHGACVMELASMLAGEPFSDHPESVCPVIGSFLRAYNDALDDERRQDLYLYASRVVGSRASEGVQRARSERLAEWARERQPRWRRALPCLTRRSVRESAQALEAAGAHAARAIRRHTDQSHAQALALIDELLAIGRRTQARTPHPQAWRQASIQLLHDRHTGT